jgi:hypothetical protein
MRSKKPNARAADQMIDATHAAWGRSQNIIRIVEGHDPFRAAMAQATNEKVQIPPNLVVNL